jgi:hypothetical protein
MHGPFPQASGAFQLQLQSRDSPSAARITFETVSAWRDIALAVVSGTLASPKSTRLQRAQDEQRGASTRIEKNHVQHRDLRG